MIGKEERKEKKVGKREDREGKSRRVDKMKRSKTKEKGRKEEGKEEEKI